MMITNFQSEIFIFKFKSLKYLNFSFSLINLFHVLQNICLRYLYWTEFVVNIIGFLLSLVQLIISDFSHYSI